MRVRMQSRLWLVAMVGFLLFGACSDSDDGGSPTQPGRLIALAALPPEIALDGGLATIAISVLSEIGLPVSNAEVTLSTDLGLINGVSEPVALVADEFGLTIAGFRADGVAGTATITARSGGAESTTQVVVMP